MKEEFNRILQQCIEETFNEIFGREGAKTVYYHLGKELSADIIHPRSFSEILHRLFGSGAYAIERIIIRKLYHELGIEYSEKENYSFTGYIEDAKKTMETKRREKKP